jgi:3-methyladenine DNA glycosylase AlkD
VASLQHDIISSLRTELKKSTDANTLSSTQHYFKEPVKVYGVKTATVENIARQSFRSVKDLDKAQVFALCEALFQSDYCEEAYVACSWAYSLRDQFAPADFAIFENWLNRYINNWAKCDTLCNHTIGTFIEKYPSYIENLKQWALSDNRWLRRASSVTLIIPARKGLFLEDIRQIADFLLMDKDDLVQKGYGWMLKAASQAHPTEVFDYVIQHKTVMPRTALRYAIEKMPADLKRQAMQKTGR